MEYARISFSPLLKNNFKKIWICFKAFLVREMNNVEKSIFKKIQKSPKKYGNSKKEVRFLWDVSYRLHKIDIDKKWDSFLVESPKSASLLHKKYFLHVFEKCPKMAFFGVFLKTFLLHSYRETDKNPCREVLFKRLSL